MASRTGCPVVVNADRVAAAKTAIALGADIILSDDGLQHYRLARDYEIAVIDGSRGFGNGRMLPAGPLRELPSRLRTIDQVLEQRSPGKKSTSVFRRSDDRKALEFQLVPSGVTSLDGKHSRSIDEYVGEEVHAVAAIGNPYRFFDLLESMGIKVNEHPLRDHAAITATDISFHDELPVLMTEKDAVKCRGLRVNNCWYVPVELEFYESRGEAWVDFLVQRLSREARQDTG
jgi:tetraacyldisaccharide 4'-kinase